MAYDKVAGAPDDSVNPSSTQDTTVGKKTDKKVIEDGGGSNPDGGGGHETPSFWIKVGATRGF